MITRPSGEKQFVVSDHLGSTRSIYTSLGVVWGQYDYEPFGKLVSGTQPRSSYIDRERDEGSLLLKRITTDF